MDGHGADDRPGRDAARWLLGVAMAAVAGCSTGGDGPSAGAARPTIAAAPAPPATAATPVDAKAPAVLESALQAPAPRQLPAFTSSPG